MEFLKNGSILTEFKTVETGAVVVSEPMTFYICLSTEDFEVAGKQLVGMSTKATLFLAIQGKKKCDTFIYKEKLYTI